jgi:WD40 repeat protein
MKRKLWLNLFIATVAIPVVAQERKWDNNAPRHAESITSVAWSPDGSMLASGSRDESIRLWNVPTGEMRMCLEPRVGYELSDVDSVAFSPNGLNIAAGSHDNLVRVWRISDGKNIAVYTGHSDWVSSVAWRPDGKVLASGSQDGTCRLWDIASGRCAAVLEGHAECVNSIAWSPDGKKLASASSDTTVRVWDAAAAKTVVILTLPEFSDVIGCVAFAPDGKTVASSEYHGAFIWDMATGRHKATLTGHADTSEGFGVAWPNILCLTFRGQGIMLATGSSDNTIKLWNWQTQQLAGTLVGHNSDVCTLAFSPDGKTLASAGDDRTIRLWDIISIAPSPPKGSLAPGERLLPMCGQNAVRRANTVIFRGRKILPASEKRGHRVVK